MEIFTIQNPGGRSFQNVAAVASKNSGFAPGRIDENHVGIVVNAPGWLAVLHFVR